MSENTPSIRDVQAKLMHISNEITSAEGAFQQVVTSYEQTQALLLAVGQGTGQADISETYQLLGTVITAATEAQQAAHKAVEIIERVATDLGKAAVESSQVTPPPAKPPAPATAPASPPFPPPSNTGTGRTYSEQVKDIAGQLAGGIPPMGLDQDYEGAGEQRIVYSDENNPDVLIKISHTKYDARGNVIPPETIHEEYVKVFQRTEDIDGYERLADTVPPSDEHNGAVVVERAPGKSLDTMTSEEINEIPVKDYEALLRNIDAGTARGVEPDMAGNVNTFYDPQRGFVLIDSNMADSVVGPSESDPTEVFASAQGLFGSLSEGSPAFPEAGRRFLKAYRNVHGDEATEALKSTMQQSFDEKRKTDPHYPHQVPDNA